jgi:hypothetical protein
MFEFKKSSGQASKLLLVLAVIIFVAVIITFLVLKMVEKPPAPVVPTTPTIPVPTYEKQINSIDFVFLSAIDRGNVLKASEIVNKQFSANSDFVIDNPGAKFIQVSIGAKNMSTLNTPQGAWAIENIVDSQGRNFVPLEGYTINPWIPADSSCGELLKPAFDPSPCTKIYEVSKESTGLKVRVMASKDKNTTGKKDAFLIDLIVK